MPDKFKPMKARFRATFAAGSVEEPRIEKIDKEAEILYGVQITLEGEAKGHGVFLDRAFCEAVVEAGNAKGEAGVKCRFGHPAMCSDAIGTYLGRCKNFRLTEVTRKESGEKACGVLADLYISPESHYAPAGDLGKWIMKAAENSPDQFGQSIIFTYADLKSTNAEGNPILRSEFESDRLFEEAAGENKVFVILGKLHGSDFTDTPAATDGAFSQDSLAAEAEEMLAEHPEIEAVLTAHPEKVVEFLDRIGLLDAVKTKRISGLQAAKDKTIAELREIVKVQSEGLSAKDVAISEVKNEITQIREQLATEESIRGELAAKNEQLNTDIAEKTAALETAASEIQQLKDTAAETEKALSETKAALEVEIKRYRNVVGRSLSQPSETTTQTWAARYRAAVRQY